MNYTDMGTKVKREWMPLAMANGVEWMQLRREHRDRFCNLYRNRLSLNAALWYAGAILEFLFRVGLGGGK